MQNASSTPVIPVAKVLLLQTLVTDPVKPADAATILARKRVLSYVIYNRQSRLESHGFQNFRDYIVSCCQLRSQIKMLADSGYHALLLRPVMPILLPGAALPSKPVLITFDDTDLDQYTTAAPELKNTDSKATYFIMTVSLGYSIT